MRATKSEENHIIRTSILTRPPTRPPQNVVLYITNVNFTHLEIDDATPIHAFADIKQHKRQEEF